MKRRDAIKSITLSTGLVITASAWTSLLQSCTPATRLNWRPLYFSEDEAKTVSALADLIIPKEDGIGALDVHVPQVIDRFLFGAKSKGDQEKFQEGYTVFEKAIQKEYGDFFFELSKEKQLEVLTNYFKLPAEEHVRIMNVVAGNDAQGSEEYFIYIFLTMTRDLAIHTYRTSEVIGKEVLSYDPIPGVYQGCIPIEEVGNAWSL